MDSFPPIEEFYSSLKQSGITQEEYERAQRVWETFDVSNVAGDFLIQRLDFFVPAGDV